MAPARATADSGAVRTFLLTLDAVPYSAVAALEASGAAPELFGELGEPIPLISTFPSTTTVALAAALEELGLERSPGYEARFFDWQHEKVRGGGAISYFRIEFPWRSFFDWSKKGVARSALASLRPVGASERRVVGAFEAFLASDLDDFFAYIETTDTAAHLRGPASLDGMFRILGRAIATARRAGEEFRVVVFSDHGIAGGEKLVNVLPGIHRQLEGSGFRRSKRLRHARDVVLTPYGLVSSFEAYAHEEDSARVAEALVAVDGVALCAYRDPEDLWVVSRDGRASIRRNLSGDWAYRPLVGDPLGYRDLLDALAATRSESNAADWYTDRQWFEASQDEFYPDALSRIAGGFELVDNPASVLCSVAPGYMFGARKTQRAATLAGGPLKWTHGALHWEATVGFLLTDLPKPGLSGALRLSEVLGPLVAAGSEQRRASARRAESPPALAVTVRPATEGGN